MNSREARINIQCAYCGSLDLELTIQSNYYDAACNDCGKTFTVPFKEKPAKQSDSQTKKKTSGHENITYGW